MGNRLIITEEEKKNILFLYEQQLPQNNLNVLYNKIKDKPIVKKIESLYDDDLNKFLNNVVNAFPKFKGKQNDMMSKLKEFMSNPDSVVRQYGKDIETHVGSQLQEQGAAFATTWVIICAIMLIIGTIQKARYKNKNKNPQTTPTPQTKIEEPKLSEADEILKQFQFNTLNLYNDEQEQILFGRETIISPKFVDVAPIGGRSGVIFGFGQYTSSDVRDTVSLYEVPCLSNPSRLANFIVKKGKYDIDSRKYNKNFTEQLNSKVGQFCRKPEADFGVKSSTQKNNTIG